ncbi:MAG TPA: hypothetical protein VH438_04720 [Gemmatimonadales bacterium]
MNQAPADSLRAVLDSVFAAPAYQWVEPPRPFAFLGRWWRGLEDWLAAFREGNPQLFEVFFWALVLILVMVLVHASYVMLQTIRAAGVSNESRVPQALEQHDAAWYRRRAEHLASEGRFLEAMPLDFLALMLELDGRQVVRFQGSKTPGEYAAEAQLPEDQRALLREAVRGLYGHVFAEIPCGPDEYLAWRDLTEGRRYAAAQ